MSDRSGRIGAIVDIMKRNWDLPADCNEGELYTYAEILLDRIDAGEDKAALYAFLADAQVKALEMPASDASRLIVDQAVDSVRTSG